MADYLKNGFLLGLGAALSGKEYLERKLGELVEKNELTQDQAKKVLSDFIAKGEEKTDEWSDKQMEQTQKMADDLGVVTLDNFKVLVERVATLEEELRVLQEKQNNPEA